MGGSRSAAAWWPGIAIGAVLGCAATLALELAIGGLAIPWEWRGWAGVGALAQVGAVVATLLTLIFFGIQIREMRGQARREAAQRVEEYRRENTPIVSLVVKTSKAEADAGEAAVAAVVSGSGIVRGLSVTWWDGPDRPERPLGFMPKDVVAPDEIEFNVSWRAWKAPQEFTFQVTGFGTFSDPIDFTQRGTVLPHRQLVLAEPPRR